MVESLANAAVSFFGPKITAAHPWLVDALTVLVLLAIPLVILLVVVPFRRSLRSATEHSIFGGIYKWKTLGNTRELEDNIKKLNRDAEIKSNIIFLAKLFIMDSVDLIGSPDSAAINRLAGQLLAGLPDVLRSDSRHRCAVLVEEPGSGNLKVLYGMGYSDRATREMRLGIANTCAGEAYRVGDVYYCKDKNEDRKWTRLPDSTHEYRSVICLPIRGGGRVLGVLNVDSVEPNAFSTDDIAALQFFASHFAILLMMVDLISSKREVASS